MNCKLFRRTVGADPAASTPEIAGHAAACGTCRAFRQDMLVLDNRIGRALAIDVPPLEMPDLPPVAAGENPRKVVSLPNTSRFRSPLWLGLAAGIATAAILMFGWRGIDRGSAPLAEQILAHMDHEEASRTVTRIPVSFDTLEAVVAPKVSAMDEELGLITYAMSCVINGRSVPHLVVQGRSGPITLILLPEETLEASIPLSGRNVQGVILPVGGGSVAVIGQREDQQPELDEIGRRLARTLAWKT